MRPYAPRPIAFSGVLARASWRLKLYDIALGLPHAGGPLLPSGEFAEGMALALAALPETARTEERPGVGFVVRHRGAGADYIVLGWWDRENELPVRIFVRDQMPGAAWRTAAASESFCVWDLQVIAFERDAYVETVLAEGNPQAADAYLARTLSAPAGDDAGSSRSSLHTARAG